MKRFLKTVLVIIILLAIVIVAFNIFAFCVTRENWVLLSIGWYKNKQFWTHGGFQDYTDYGVYYCPTAKLENNRYFSKVTSDDIENIGGYVDNFENWVETIRRGDADDELVVNYNFDRGIIDESDYFYIYSKGEYSKFANYDLWIFDSQTEKLYYFHSNI